MKQYVWLIAGISLLAIGGSIHGQESWLVTRGNLQRTSAAAKANFFEKRVAWQRPLLMDQYDGQLDPEKEAQVALTKALADAPPFAVPGFYPLIAKDQCIYRSYRDVRSVALVPLVIKDDVANEELKVKPSEIAWKTIPHYRSLSVLLRKSSTKAPMATVLDMLAANKQSELIWSNANIGALNCDGETVVVIDDFAFPIIELQPKKGFPINLGDLKFPLFGNRLYAYDIVSGKILFDTDNDFGANVPFKDSFFLGAPLILDSKLLALNEKAGELRIVQFDINRKTLREIYPRNVDKTAVLAKVPANEQILRSPLRRSQAAHMALAGDLLVVPTHFGILLGVDRAKLTVSWEYRYREEKVQPPPAPLWQAACPIVAGDRIVFTAADSGEIHCIDLKGKKQWTAAADKALYLATVHDGIVMLVGQTECRGLSLKDGMQKWRLEVGVPAGVGVLDGAQYLVPLRRSATTNGPTIWGIDVAKGTKVRRVDVPHPDAIGNLALHRGMLVSQSATHIAAFPLGADLPK
jgi:hypothetical protein